MKGGKKKQGTKMKRVALLEKRALERRNRYKNNVLRAAKAILADKPELVKQYVDWTARNDRIRRFFTDVARKVKSIREARKLDDDSSLAAVFSNLKIQGGTMKVGDRTFRPNKRNLGLDLRSLQDEIDKISMPPPPPREPRTKKSQ